MSTLSVSEQLAARRAAETAGEGAATQPGTGQPLVAPPAAMQQTGQVREETPMEKLTHALATAKTYVHQVAGANTIMPDGKKLIFGGKTGRALQGGGWLPGGFGYYTTDLPAEIKWLEDLCKAPTSQITRLIEDKVRHVEVIEQKKVDPALLDARNDAAANSARAMDPNISKAQEGLAHTIAMNANQQNNTSNPQ